MRQLCNSQSWHLLGEAAVTAAGVESVGGRAAAAAAGLRLLFHQWPRLLLHLDDRLGACTTWGMIR